MASRRGAGNSQIAPRSAKASSRTGRWLSITPCSDSSAFGRASFLLITTLFLEKRDGGICSGAASARRLRGRLSACWIYIALAGKQPCVSTNLQRQIGNPRQPCALPEIDSMKALRRSFLQACCEKLDDEHLTRPPRRRAH